MMRSAVLSIVLACALVGCGTPQADPPAVVETPSVEPTSESTPSEVGFGYAQSVAWTLASDLVGEVTISVEKVRAGDFKDFAGLAGSGISEANAPFYVDVLISNEGDADLGGLDVPLYLEDSRGILSPPWGFATPFEPCAPGLLPDTFAAGDEAELCLVFFGSPDASFESIIFQPTTETTSVRWAGEVAAGVTPQGKKGQRRR